MTVPFSGGCQCRAVRYEVSAEPLAVFLCHCRACQYESAGGPSVVVMVPVEAFKLNGTPKGHTVIADSGTPTTRCFCGECGTPLFGKPSGDFPFVMLRAGSMDDASWLKPHSTIWVSSAQPWAAISDKIPRFERNPVM
jgi:hypothetical protein